MEELIIDELLDKIIAGQFEQGEPLPSENVLSRRYDVSRMMVRKAYDNLEERGYIRSVKGKGRFLSDPKRHVQLSLRSDISFTEKLKAMGADFITHNLGAEPAQFNRKVWMTLGAEEREVVYSISLMRIIEAEPIAIHTSFLRLELFPDISERGRYITSMYSYLSEKGYADFKSEHTTMNVTLPTLAEQSSLDCPSLVPLLLLEYETSSRGNDVIQYNKIIYRGDRFKYSI